MNRKKVLGQIRDLFWLTVASFIFAFAWEGFMIPNGLSAGGMMGLCTVLQYATAGVIKAQYSYIVVNGLLIIIAVWAMGIGFGFKTIYSIAVSSLAMQLLGSMDFLHCLPGQFFYVRETLLIPVIAGVLEGVGIGMVIRYGGSTGGTDIVALMINKFWPVSLSKAFLIMDFFIIALIEGIKAVGQLRRANHKDKSVELFDFFSHIDKVNYDDRIDYYARIDNDETIVIEWVNKAVDSGQVVFGAESYIKVLCDYTETVEGTPIERAYVYKVPYSFGNFELNIKDLRDTLDVPLFPTSPIKIRLQGYTVKENGEIAERNILFFDTTTIIITLI